MLPSRNRGQASSRRIALIAGNLLTLLGAIVLGSSIAAATPPVRQVVPASVTAVAQPAQPHVGHAGQHHHSSVSPSGRAVTAPAPAPASPTSAGPAARPSTPTPTPAPRPPLPPHPGEELVQALVTTAVSSGPYAQNVDDGHVVQIIVPAVGIDTPVVEVAPVPVEVGGQTVFDWPVADWAAGHHSTSADPGDGGNIVIAGHDDVRGEVFRGLHDVSIGDVVTVVTNVASYDYVVTEIHMRLFKNQPLDEQLTIGTFISPMPEERLTLVTCWPYRVDTHRLIVVAKPVR